MNKKPEKKEVSKKYFNFNNNLTQSAKEANALNLGYNECYDDYEKFLPNLIKEVEEEQWSKIKTLNPDSEEYSCQYKKALIASEIITAISKRLRGEE